MRRRGETLGKDKEGMFVRQQTEALRNAAGEADLGGAETEAGFFFFFNARKRANNPNPTCVECVSAFSQTAGISSLAPHALHHLLLCPGFAPQPRRTSSPPSSEGQKR